MPDSTTHTTAARPRLNSYHCATCGGDIVTVDRDEGVTPMFLACRATEGCPGRSASAMYRVPTGLTPTWEWYRPGKRQVRRMDPKTRDHVQRSGLALRRIEDDARA